MKSTVVVLIAGIILLAGVPAFAQTQPAQPQSAAQAQAPAANGYPKEAYVKSIPLFRIMVHPLGYQLLYWKSNMQIGQIYIPLTWFNAGTTSKAEITYGTNPSRPYVSIFWVDGKFDHLSINALADMTGPTWGTASADTDLTAQFNVQEPPKDF